MTSPAPLHLIINGFHEAHHDAVWQALFARLPIASVEAIVSHRTRNAPSGVKLVKHLFSDLSFRAAYGTADTTPIDEALLDEMADVETTFLRMSDRLEAAGPAPYAMRKRLYLRHVQHWNHVLRTRPITAAVFCNIPHETYDFVLYELCRRRGVPTLCFNQSHVEDSFLVFEDWRDVLPGARERLAELANDPEDGVAPHGLKGRYLAHFEKHTRRASSPVPFWMQRRSNVTWTDKLATTFTQLTSPRSWTGLAYRDYVARRESLKRAALERCYGRLIRKTHAGTSYIYLPLHYQPELTTSPLAGQFVDQALIAHLLSAATPPGVEIWIKEHPIQGSIGRSVEFYEELAEIPRVRLLPKNTDTFELIANALAVATCTGTAGWEALFRGKPVLMFGDYLYQYATGVFRIRSRADLEDALTRMVKEAPTLVTTARFLRLLQERALEGCIDGDYKKVSSVDDARSAANISDALCAWLEGLEAR